MSRLVAFAAIFISLLAQSGQASVSVWSEFTPFATVAQALPLLCEGQTGLNLAVHDGDWEQPEFASLWRQATDCGIPLHAWLLLKPELGYWVNAGNTGEVRDLVARFLAFMDSKGLKVSRLTFDLEPSPEFQRDMSERLVRWDFIGVLHILKDGASSSRLSEARADLNALVDTLHARQIQAHAVTMPFVIDDLEEGASRVQAALGIPFSGVAWDEVSFMLYRPEFQRALRGIGPRIIYDYALRAARLFPPEKLTIDLGEVGTVGYPDPVKGYVDPSELWKDMAAVQAAGVDRIGLYSLDGILEEGQFMKWIRVPTPSKPRASLLAELLERLITWARKALPPDQLQESQKQGR
jgi:hypothetical protein